MESRRREKLESARAEGRNTPRDTPETAQIARIIRLAASISTEASNLRTVDQGKANFRRSRSPR
jgi:hypothetical protein